MRHKYTVPWLQDFSVPLICCCGLGVSKGGLDGLGGVSKLPPSQSYSSRGTCALQNTLGKGWTSWGQGQNCMTRSPKGLGGVGRLCSPSWAVCSLSVIDHNICCASDTEDNKCYKVKDTGNCLQVFCSNYSTIYILKFKKAFVFS